MLWPTETGELRKVMYKNHEGYRDPTAGAAIARASRKEKRAE